MNITFKNLHNSYIESGKNKKKNPDYIGFTLHKCRNILKIQNDVQNHTLQSFAKAYVVFKPVVREVFAAFMNMCVLHHYERAILYPLMEQYMNDCVYNNRVGRGLDRALQKIQKDIYEVSNGYTEDCWCIVTDISGYFPNANQQRMYEILKKLLIGQNIKHELLDALLYILQTSVYFNPKNAIKISPQYYWDRVDNKKSLFCKSDGIGAAPGELIMQLAMTFYHDDVIKWLISMGVRVTVYGDDFAFIVKNKHIFNKYILPEFRNKMKSIGCIVHPNKYYCQHYTKGIKFCSQIVKITRIYCGNRTINNFHVKIRHWNKRVSIKNLSHFLSSINSYIGIMKIRTEYANIRKGLNHISDRWYKYVYFDEKTKTLKAKQEYAYNQALILKHRIRTVEK